MPGTPALIGHSECSAKLASMRRTSPGSAPMARRCRLLRLASTLSACQFAFHHVADKAGLLRAVLRLLRPGGRFVMRNMCPQESGDWLYYEYFPEAKFVDLRDFDLRIP
jgi:SAM-dependent methyltransferase